MAEEEPQPASPEAVEKKQVQYSKLYNLLRQANKSKYVRTDAAPAEVVSGLFVGSIGSTVSLEALRNLGVTHVLSVGFGMANPHPDQLAWMGVNTMDTPQADLARHIPACHGFIDGALGGGGKVLVHCHQGKSRSVTIVASYLMRRDGLGLEQAMDTIRAVRPGAAPNAGFIAQLLKYQRSLRGSGTGEGGGGETKAVPDEAGVEVSPLPTS